MFGLYTRLIAIAVICAAIAGAIFYVKHLQSAVKELETQIVLKDQAIKEQNEAVDALKAASDKKQAEAQAALKLAQVETAKAKAKATTIFKVKPTDPSNLCKSALDLVNQGAPK